MVYRTYIAKSTFLYVALLFLSEVSYYRKLTL